MTSNDLGFFNANISKPKYLNGKVVRVYEEDIYDIRLSTGQVEAYVENVSSNTYNSGDYVAVLIIDSRESKTCKIIGKGRKMTTPSLIKKVMV